MKRYLLALVIAFLINPFSNSKAADQLERPWPEMAYRDKSGTNLRLVSLKEITRQPFVNFVTTLFSKRGVFELYENGERWNEARAQRLWDRVFPRTCEWFKGNDSFIPWTVILNEQNKVYIGILGTHLHTDKATKEYQGVELCVAIFPEYKNIGAISNAIRIYLRAFSPQLESLGDRFTRIIAPISPINFNSLRLALSLNCHIGQIGTVDQPYVSSYYQGPIDGHDRLRLLAHALKVVTKFQESPRIDPMPQNLSIPPGDWEKLKALRVVALMSKEILFKQLIIEETMPDFPKIIISLLISYLGDS